MQSEIEVKFVNVDHDAMRLKLEATGAILEKPLRMMRRAIIETPELKAQNGFVRIRDEGDRTTLTYKQFDSLSIDGAKEIEVTVNDYSQTVVFFAAIGLRHKSYQESKRETWRIGDVEVVLDIWPWLNPFIEIEGSSIESVKSVSATLGFDWKNAVFGDVMAAYKLQYPHLSDHDTVSNLHEVKFGDPAPKMLQIS
jgi:adenylate cyclase class 2